MKLCLGSMMYLQWALSFCNFVEGMEYNTHLWRYGGTMQGCWSILELNFERKKIHVFTFRLSSVLEMFISFRCWYSFSIFTYIYLYMYVYWVAFLGVLESSHDKNILWQIKDEKLIGFKQGFALSFLFIITRNLDKFLWTW